MASTTTRTAPPEEQEAVASNPRTARSQEKLEQAKGLIAKELESGEWVSSAEIHRRLGDRIVEGTFGRAKSALGVEHRRVREDGKVEYQWRKPKPATRTRAKATAKS